MSNAKLVRKVQKFVDDLAAAGGKPLYELSPEEARKVLIKVQDVPVNTEEMSFEDVNVPVRDGENIIVRFVRPKDAAENLPVIYYVHGGGWIMGNLETHDRLVRELSRKVRAAVVYPVYTPSPEAQYPRPPEELFSALLHIAENAGRYRIDAGRLALAGDSVGGNMAAALTLMAKANGNVPAIRAQLLLYPVTNDDFETESYRAFADGPWLTRKAMEWFWDAYAPEKSDRSKVTVCPLKADISELEGLPPALVITDENDVLRDEGEAYARKLDEAGVDAACVRFNGTIHDFMMLNALAETPQTKAAIALAADFLKKYLSSVR